MMFLKHIKIWLGCFLFTAALISTTEVRAQVPDNKDIALARQYMQNKEYEKAIPLFKKLYDEAPFEKGAYNEYLDALMLAAKFDDAKALVTYMSQIRRGDPAMFVDMGKVLEANKEDKKAKEQFELAVEKLTGDDFATRATADAFTKIGHNDYAIKTYERARVLIQNQYQYSTELSLLYSKEGDTEKAMNALMDVLAYQPNTLEDIKASLAQMVEGNQKNMDLLQKQLGKRIAAQPDNPYWNELTTWAYIQKGNYEGAFQQITGIDKKLKEEGERVLNFSLAAAKDEQFEIALKGFDYVMKKGPNSANYELAWVGKIQILLQQLQSKRPVDQKLLSFLLTEYKNLLDSFPQYQITPVINDYAMVQARYAGQVDTAIHILQQAIDAPNAGRIFVGKAKLDLGDYYLLANKVWDASLIYSQVDKAFKEDFLGEDARFRNAKLAYYRGDFEWAQTQLSVLKASTTELIANDALYLSVLITENTPADSNLVPLLRFAAADLLLFQSKTQESDKLLDSISKAFPKTELQDDILMLRGNIASEEGRYNDAITYWEKVLNEFGDDVLGDDAAYKLATLYDNKIKDKAKAIQYYETLITKYPGSTYVQIARSRYQILKNGKTPSS